MSRSAPGGRTPATSPPLRLGYSVLLSSVLLVGTPFWLVRMLTSGRYRAGLAERLGRTPAALRGLPTRRNTLWLHAVSVGEVLAAVGLVRALARELPGWTFAVSTTTATGQQIARERLGNDPALRCPVFYLPLDFAVLMRRTLRLLRPRLVILMESELWPNMLGECCRAGVPVAVANARISDRSFPRYVRLRRLWRPLFAMVNRFLAQGEETADRLRTVGTSPGQVVVTGNLKYDLPALTDGPVVKHLRSRLPPDAPVLVAGSTLEGEEQIVLSAWREVVREVPDAILILAPRHPDRFRRVAGLIIENGFLLALATEFGQSSPVSASPLRTGSVVLLDTLGDLASVYSLAMVAFVGGSLVPSGGHNPLEPARFAVPVLLGSSSNNFREIVEVMRATHGVLPVDEQTLAAAVLRLFRDPGSAQQLGLRGKEVFTHQTGATERTVRELLDLLRPSMHGHSQSPAAMRRYSAVEPEDAAR